MLDATLDKGLTSDAALAVIREDLIAPRFSIEQSKSGAGKIRRPAYFGKNGVPSLAYEIDGFHPGWCARRRSCALGNRSLAVAGGDGHRPPPLSKERSRSSQSSPPRSNWSHTLSAAISRATSPTKLASASNTCLVRSFIGRRA